MKRIPSIIFVTFAHFLFSFDDFPYVARFSVLNFNPFFVRLFSKKIFANILPKRIVDIPARLQTNKHVEQKIWTLGNLRVSV